MSKQENISIGAKELDKEQMDKVLPGYTNIYKQIENMRRYAKDNRIQNNNLKRMIYENTTINNVFSILGKRGGGKSSILVTLKNQIQTNKYKRSSSDNKNKLDIVLPIILPIILPNSMKNRGDLMGWILGLFKDEVNNLSKEKAKRDNKQKNEGDSFPNCRKDSENTELYNKYTEVLKQYSYTKEDYSDILKKNYSGLKEYVEKSKKVLDPENELKKSFFEFIDELIKIKIEINDNGEEPMIFIFMDDIDLTKNHCQEILSLIARYLCHPNIVVFISGDYDIFETEQFMSYMKDGNLMNLIVSPKENNFEGNRLLMNNKSLAKDALKKIMPPAYRYKLKNLSAEERLNFYYKDDSTTLKQLLERKFFKHFDKDHKVNVIKAYGLMFDEMPRGVMNVYYALSNLEDNIIKKLKYYNKSKDRMTLEEEDKKKDSLKNINEFRILVDTIIHSSSVLSIYEEAIKKCIQINYPFSQTFFNHERLVKEIKETNNIKQNNKNKEIDIEFTDKVNKETMVVLIFAHFIESIVKLVNPNRKIHGQQQIWTILNELETQKGKFKIYPRIKKTNIIFDLYESMLSNDALNIMPTMDNIYLKDFSVKFYFNELEKIEEMNMSNIDVGSIAVQDSEWMEEKFKIIYYHRDPLCMMFNKAVTKVLKQVKFDKEENSNQLENKFYRTLCSNYIKEMYKQEVQKKESDNVEDIVKKGVTYWIEKLYTILEDQIKDYTTENWEKIDINKNEYMQDLERAISKYLADFNMNKKDIKYDETKSHDDKSIKYEDIHKILYIAVLYNTLKEMNSIKPKDGSELYEIEYFSYFEQWHEALIDKDAYKTWIKNKKDDPQLKTMLEECIKIMDKKNSKKICYEG